MNQFNPSHEYSTCKCGVIKMAEEAGLGFKKGQLQAIKRSIDAGFRRMMRRRPELAEEEGWGRLDFRRV